jgi:hypothetical protein
LASFKMKIQSNMHLMRKQYGPGKLTVQYWYFGRRTSYDVLRDRTICEGRGATDDTQLSFSWILLPWPAAVRDCDAVVCLLRLGWIAKLLAKGQVQSLGDGDVMQGDPDQGWKDLCVCTAVW